jgi:alkylhydroperoxidase family enzyme
MPDADSPRLAPLSDAECTDEQRALLAPLGANASLNLFRTIVRHPRLYRRWEPFAGRLLLRSTFSDRERELVILRVSSRCGADYEWGHHVEIGRGVGLTDDEILRAGAAEVGDGWSEPERTLLTAVDQLVDAHAIDEPTWTALEECYTDEQLIELTLLAGAYAMLAGTINSLGIELEGGLPGLGEV